MAVKWTTKKDLLPQIESNLKALRRQKVKVGALRGDHAWLAGIHEYGVDIEVTPKMRAFLHYNGLHLKDSTTHIKIPERSFLRTGHDENVDRVLEQTSRALSQVIAGKMDIDTMLDLYGEQMATAIKTYMRDLSNPPNHPYTTEQKGSSNPLIDSGALLESIIWEKK